MISFDQIKSELTNHAKTLIQEQKLEYEEFKARIEKCLEAVKNKITDNPEIESIKEAYHLILGEIKHPDFFAKHSTNGETNDKELHQGSDKETGSPS